MPIDPQDPNNPNNPPIQPNIPPVDLSKLIDTEGATAKMAGFLQDALAKIVPGFKKELKEVKKDLEDVWEETTVDGVRKLRRVSAAARETVNELAKIKNLDISNMSKLEASTSKINENLTHSAENLKKLQSVAHSAGTKNPLQALSAQPKIILSEKEKAFERKMDEPEIVKLTAEQEKADRKHAADVQKFLRITMGAEKTAIRDIVKERRRLLDVIDKEYAKKVESAKAEASAGKSALEVQQKLISLEQQQEKAKTAVRKEYADKERKERGNSNPWDLSKFTGGNIAKRAEADIASTVTNTLEKFSSLATVAGGLAAIFMSLLGTAQEYLIAQNALTAQSRNALGLGQTAEKNVGKELDLRMQASELYKAAAYKIKDRAETVGIMASSPKLLQETSTKEGFAKFDAFQSILALFKVDLKDSAKIAANATNELGVSLDDLSSVAVTAIQTHKAYGAGITETIQQILHLSAGLRTVSYGTRDANTILHMFNNTMLKTKGGLTPSQQDIKKLQEAFSSGIAGIDVDKFAGLFAYVNKDQRTGDQLPTVADYEKQAKGGGVAETVLVAITKGMGDLAQRGEGGTAVIPTLKHLTEKFANFKPDIPQSLQLLEVVRKISEAGGDTKAIEKASAAYNEKVKPIDIAKIQKDGVEAQKGATTVMGKLESALETLTSKIADAGGLTDTVKTLNDTFKLFSYANKAVEAVGDIKSGIKAGVERREKMINNLPKDASRLVDDQSWK